MRKPGVGLAVALAFVWGGPWGHGESEGFPFVLSEQEVRAAASADAEGMAETVRVLSALPSRVPGYGGTRKAADYIRDRLEAAGLSDIQALPFTVTAPVQRNAQLTLGELSVELDAFWPNLVRTCTTPPEGLTGPLVYGKQGSLAALKGKAAEGAILVLDYNCGRQWLNAPALGAKAVLFVEPEETTHFESAAKFLRTPVNVPRFLLSRGNWRTLRSAMKNSPDAVGTIRARVDWEDVAEVNIAAWVKGTGAAPNAFGNVLADEVIVISSYYDAMSVVPARAPGAEQACGIAALLELTEYFAQHPPPRTVLFLATSAHGLFMQGVTEFLDRQLTELAVTPATFIALDLASSGDKVGAYNVGHAYWDGAMKRRLPNLFTPVGTQLNAIGHRTSLALGLYTEQEYVEREIEKNPLLGFFVESLTGTSLSKAGTGWGYTLPTGMVHEAETANLFGHLAYAFVTWDSPRPLVDSPLDTFDHFDAENLARQVRFLKPMLNEMLHSEDPVLGFITRIEQIVDWNRQAHRAQFFPPSGHNAGVVTGRVVEFVPKKNYIPDEPKNDALVVVRRENANTYLGVRCEPIQRVRSDKERTASFRFANIGRAPRDYFTNRPREIDAYVLDPNSGAVTYAKDLGRNGELSYPTAVYGQTTPPEVTRTVVVFPCYPLDLFDLFDPRYMQMLSSVRLLDGQTNAEPESYGHAIAPPDGSSGGGGEPGAHQYYDPCAALFVHRKEGRPHAVKILGAAGVFGQRMALLNATADTPTGIGFNAAVGRIYNTALHASRDMVLLNGQRISDLADTGILSAPPPGDEAVEAPDLDVPLVIDLHLQSGRELARAEEALADLDYPTYIHRARSAWALASRAYPIVLRTGNDAVLSVLFYLALLLPSAFFLEKLLFGFPDVKRQLIGRAAIFGLVFLLLRFANPAFKLTVNPYVVLLGFVMIALTVGVLRVILKMFQTELKKLRAQVTGIHNVEIGRSDAAGVAFGLGLSSMRKRKVRTANTLVTLVILTFSILSFTSVVSKNELKGRELYDQSLNRIEAPYNGVLFRTPLYTPIIADAYEYILNEFQTAEIIAPRAWYPGGNAPMGTMAPVTSAEGATVTVPCMLGLTAQEEAIALTNPEWLQGDWFEPGERDAAILPASLAERLGLSEGDIGKPALTLSGRTFRLKGIIADAFFERDHGFCDIDGEPLSPVNYAMSATTYQEARSTRPDIVAQKPPPTFTHFDGLNTIIIPFDVALEMGGNIRSIAIVTDDPQGVSERTLRDDVLNKLATGLFAGMDGMSYWYTSLGHSDFKGLFSLLILILIATLIVFNTILGSLYERQREIGIYTSLGLAPSHIGAFFLAESCVYAVLGCLFGYLLGQVVGRVRADFGFALLEGLALNYSSRSALYATLIVSAVVMLSSLYPAWKASRLSVPELERSVQLPEPIEDTLHLEFPFTFSGQSRLGISVFLYRYFKEQEELATGDFHSQDVGLWEEAGEFCLEGLVWVAPFDWGISQHIRITTAEREGNPVLLCAVRRVNGEVKSWLRVNHRFVANLRRQLLLWRTIDPVDRERYVGQGNQLLASGADGALGEAAGATDQLT